LTSIYLEKEDEVLDYCKTVNFNRNARRMEQVNNSNFDLGASSSKHLPDEIDGDERCSSVNASMDR